MGLTIRPALQGHLAMLLFSALVAGSFSLGGSVANDLAPTALNAMRFWIAVVILGVVMLTKGQGARQNFVAPWRYLALGGMFAFYFVMMFEGLKTAQPVNTSVVFTLTPVLSAVFGLMLVKQKISPHIVVALAIGAMGAVWVIFRGSLQSLLSFEVGRGEAIYFVGVISHAIYTPFARLVNRGEKVIPYTFGTLFAAAALITAYGWNDITATDWVGLRPLAWITIVYLATFATAGSSMLLLFATLRLPSSKVMAYTYLVPSWVIVWEMARHGYLPPVIVLVGVALTLVALLLLLRE